MPHRRTAVFVLAAILVLAVLCNGAGTYLKRTGWLDGAGFAGYWASHCADREHEAAKEWQCRTFTNPAEIERQARLGDARRTRFEQIYDVEGPWERALKLAKDGFWVGLLAACIALSRGRDARPAGSV